MQRGADIIVVGGGVMGCAAAYHLAKDGRRVVLLEQFAVGHTQGSSHGPSRIIRLAYDGVDYVRLARAAYTLWRELAAEAGESLLFKTGGFDFGAPNAFMLDGIRATYEAAGVPFEAVDRDEIVRRVPPFTLPEDTVGYYQPDYSLLAADRCVATLAAQARRWCATIEEGDAAQDVRATRDGVEVRTHHATYRAGGLVLCAGSWMRPLLRQLGADLPLRVRKEQLAFFEPRDPSAFMPDRFPLGKLTPENWLSWSREAKEESRDEPESPREIAGASPPVSSGHRRRVHFDQDFMVPGRGFRDLLQLETLGRSKSTVHDRLHVSSHEPASGQAPSTSPRVPSD